MNNTDHESNSLLHRIDERTTLLISKIGEMKEEMHDIRSTMTKKFVSQEEFMPVRNIVYGIVATIMMTVFAAILTMVIQK